MKEKEYVPAPIDTSSINLPDELVALSEDIARNVHEVWAAGRKAEGWKYGPERNDRDKTHPGMVPYECLTESERDYDRATSRETIKLILKLGFKISRV